jgi:hypothetical protein
MFPADANGDALQRLQANGDDLTRPRDVDFTVVFPNENAAKLFAQQVSSIGYSVTVEFAETVKECPWDVVVVKHMVPTHQEIGSFEGVLESVANPLGGHNDGWGCFSEP